MLLALLFACFDPCTDGSGEHASGDTWTCDDGCNTCSCAPDGSIVTTEMDCG
ncbi:hypothetical protein LBMAG42_51280 [Deltaproteobacteria bacterium]|nr:hypothetical protein LBMAG42_51280 [Deltaproteobacteria bacterium]